MQMAKSCPQHLLLAFSFCPDISNLLQHHQQPAVTTVTGFKTAQVALTSPLTMLLIFHWHLPDLAVTVPSKGFTSVQHSKRQPRTYVPPEEEEGLSTSCHKTLQHHCHALGYTTATLRMLRFALQMGQAALRLGRGRTAVPTACFSVFFLQDCSFLVILSIRASDDSPPNTTYVFTK